MLLTSSILPYFKDKILNKAESLIKKLIDLEEVLKSKVKVDDQSIEELEEVILEIKKSKSIVKDEINIDAAKTEFFDFKDEVDNTFSE